MGTLLFDYHSFYLFASLFPLKKRKEPKETLQDITGQGKKVNLEQTVTNFPGQILNHTVKH